ncbi:hypothetical protein [Halosimplex amylolyticum]|uniref:hypothetical protein n=1 Tax=Halosimplex amylolyticum TaxID=3396616 RepID=UPI003F56526A
MVERADYGLLGGPPRWLFLKVETSDGTPFERSTATGAHRVHDRAQKFFASDS